MKKPWDPRAWGTWEGKEDEPDPTMEEMHWSCTDNAEKAAMLLQQLQQTYERCVPGDPRIVGTKDEPGLRAQMAVAKSDMDHWRNMANWYRTEIFHGRKAVI